jgi:isocitrate/isopropylmalate dehydrogenase
MPLKILILPGDGIGPEITRATLQVLRSADAAFSLGLEFEIQDIGFASLKSQGTTLPQAVLARIPEVDGVILGPRLSEPSARRHQPVRGAARRVRPVRQYSSLPLSCAPTVVAADPWILRVVNCDGIVGNDEFDVRFLGRKNA